MHGKADRTSYLQEHIHMYVYATNPQLQAAQSGVEPSDIEVYVQGHRGRDPTQPEQLCSQTAIDRLVSSPQFLLSLHHLSSSKLYGLLVLQEKYGQEMVKRHGEGYDWRKEPVDSVAVQARGGGKAHGR